MAWGTNAHGEQRPRKKIKKIWGTNKGIQFNVLCSKFNLQCSKAKAHFTMFINEPGVAGVVLQTPPPLID